MYCSYEKNTADSAARLFLRLLKTEDVEANSSLLLLLLLVLLLILLLVLVEIVSTPEKITTTS